TSGAASPGGAARSVPGARVPSRGAPGLPEPSRGRPGSRLTRRATAARRGRGRPGGAPPPLGRRARRPLGTPASSTDAAPPAPAGSSAGSARAPLVPAVRPQAEVEYLNGGRPGKGSRRASAAAAQVREDERALLGA